jgi:hypothetical protein
LLATNEETTETTETAGSQAGTVFTINNEEIRNDDI